MLDPPLLYGMTAWLVFIAKKIHLINRLKEVTLANNRRTEWASSEEAESYFYSKALFKKFDPECLKDYVRYGTMPTENGVTLSFDVNVESKIYKTNPHNIGHLRRNMDVHGKIIMGQNTYSVTKYAMPKFAKKHNILFQQLEYGSHLFPMEYPDRTATLIREAIIELGGST